MPLKKVLFVAGTDTGAGKTIVSAAMAEAMKMKRIRVGVMKPIACGSWDDTDRLRRAAAVEDGRAIVTPIYFKQPLSPNVASKLEQKKINMTRLMENFYQLKKKYDVLIVEGCGGLLVPLQKDLFVIDLIKRMNASCILVSRSGLGAINHSLLSLHLLRAKKIKLLGMVFSRTKPGPLTLPERTNPDVISKIGQIPCLGMLRHLKNKSGSNFGGNAFLKDIELKKILC